MYTSRRRFKDGDQTYFDGIAYCDEHDIGTYGTCMRGSGPEFWRRPASGRRRHCWRPS